MKLTENERKFVKAIVDFDAHVNKAKTYLKVTYNIDATFSTDDMTCKLTSKSARKQDMDNAKEYINELFTEGMVEVIY
jgi:hypothetical protein